MTDNIHWLGHSSFRWDGSKVVYFDPYKLPPGAKKADIIFISHEHFDHCSRDDVARIATKDTLIVASPQAAKTMQRGRISCKEIKVMLPGDSAFVPGVTIKAAPAYNTDKEFHPKGDKKTGFIVTMDGVSVYHAGDTDLIPEMKDMRCDVALLPVSGTYVMTAEEAAQAALSIKPKLAVPMHYGEVIGSPDDAERFKRLLAGRVDVSILKKER